ncbi:MAG: hypothetical protein PHQ34_09340 [Methanothrix sp.]|nr:hypothetical protein [Methanothrix sp.]
MQSLHRRIISAILAYAIILILLGAASDLTTNEREARSGAIYTFAASNISQEDAIVEWSASDGSPTSYAGKSMRWTAPVVDSPKDVIISLNLTNSYNCCKNYYKIFNLHVVPNPMAKISLVKGCLFSAPVKIGDHVLYTYNVSNPGNLPLMDINLTDMQSWGPDCQPIYKSGDDGNGVLDPGETWRYECDYKVMDPSDYPILRIMQSNKGSTDLLRTIQRLMASKTRLEIIMDNLRHSSSQFDMQVASLVKAERMENGQIYTYYNYSNEVTGESFSREFDQQGNLNRTVYQDPTSGTVLTVQYSKSGKVISEMLYYPPPGTNEGLEIEYDLPAKGYNTITIVDYKSGDTLVIIVDSRGNVLSKEYRKTPGYELYVEKYLLRNKATVAAKTGDGNEVSDWDSFALEVFRPLPDLIVTKTAQTEPAVPGGLLNYTILYRNSGGSDAHDVVITETYDRNLTFVRSNPPPDAGTANRWSQGLLKIGESGSIYLQTRVNAIAEPGSEIANKVALAVRENASAICIVNTTLGRNDLNITKIASVNPVLPGKSLTYTIIYRNNGSIKQNNVTIVDRLDPYVDLANGSTQRDLTWRLGDLNPGEWGEIPVYVVVKSAIPANISSIVNRYRISSSQFAGKTRELVTGLMNGGLNITKTASSDFVPPDRELTYTISYRNEGTVNQTNVMIHDWLDPYVGLVSASANPPLISGSSGNHLWWKRGYLNPGDEGTITIKVRTNSNIADHASQIINLYKINSTQTEGRNLTLKTDVVHSLWIRKKADKTTYNREENITYTIDYGNSGNATANFVNVTDLLPDVILISVYPVPSIITGNNLTWRIGAMGENQSGTIQIVAQIPKKAKANYIETSLVQGDGYAYVRKGFSTEEKKEALINRAMIYGYYNHYPYKVSANSSVTVLGSPGTSISSLEHGSGYYREEVESTLHQENKSISLDKSLFAKYRKTAFLLPGDRRVDYDSLWSDRTRVENRIMGDSLREEYLYADTLNQNSSFAVDMNQTVYDSEADFRSAMAQIDYKKRLPEGRSVRQMIDENYHGSFRVQESVDSYGESVKFAKSAVGKGFVSSDKWTKGQQRSYESGSGYYSSQEKLELGSVDKSIKVQYGQVNLSAGSANLSYASLWNEGTRTRDDETGALIGKDIRYASSIDMETMMEKSSLSLLGKFNGTLNLDIRDYPNVDLDQTFAGSFQIDTAIAIHDMPVHLYPHVSICKTAAMLDEETVLFLINVSNDGNKLLKPLNITDYLPEGCSYINSSIRAKANGSMVNWTIPSLDVGRKLTIKMIAKVDGSRNYYTNKVSVRAVCKDKIAEANNSTTFEAFYEPLHCCPGENDSSIADNKINMTSLFNITPTLGYWGSWSPSPCFNITGNITECSAESEAYYDEMEKDAGLCSCASNYEVP